MNVGVVPSATVSISAAFDNREAPEKSLAFGEVTIDSTPMLRGQFKGSLQSSELIAVYDGSARLGVVAGADLANGRWQFQVPTALAEGEHNFRVVVETTNKVQGVPSVPFKLGVDLTAPSLEISDNMAEIAGGPVLYKLKFSEPVIALTAGPQLSLSLASAFTTTNGSVESLKRLSSNEYELLMKPNAGIDGEMSFTLNAGQFKDVAGKLNAEVSSPTQRIDTRAPVLRSDSQAPKGINLDRGQRELRLDFDESIVSTAGSQAALKAGN